MKSILIFFRNILITIITFTLVVITYLILDGYMIYKNAINEISLEDKIKQIENNVNYVEIKDIPKTYLDAVISIEDHRFYNHSGIDIISTARAMITNIIDKGFSQGGSTITQQLAKNMYFNNKKKIARKVAELFIANRLEKDYGKDKIIELYVNIVYYGDGHYGIKEASIGYFNKLPNELTLYEQTLIAGMPNAPSIYALSNHSKLTYERQNQVVDKMLELNKIDEEDANDIKEQNKYIFKK